MDEQTLRAGVLPFQIVEAWGVGCGYERSCKLSARRILANRYLLGVDTAKVDRNRFLEAARRLGMPQALYDRFHDGLPEANLVFLGFEDSEEDGCIYKIYLEYWQRLKRRLESGAGDGEPQLLHEGFKWYVDAPARQVVTRYECLPRLDAAQIVQHIEAAYQDAPSTATLEAVRRILALAASSAAGKRLLFVQVSEPGNPRRSFDLNVYPAGLRVRDAITPIRRAAASLQVPVDKLERLMSMIPDKHLGHISGGLSRGGDEYLTVYYER
ncbi:MAG: hypothetical protein U5R46_10350 [Gammaproteobacteria bacterium]|nr:hypothetical protein [Gammaproteobacteria bacterium]